MNYDLLAADYASSRHVHPGILASLVQAVSKAAVQTAVEVGCGTGNYAVALQAATTAHIFGVEPSRTMLAFAQAAGICGCQAVAEALPLRNKVCDFVYTVDVVHHLHSVQDHLAEARRVLKPGGLLCMATDSQRILATRRPLATYWPETIAGELERYHPIPRLRQWMEEEGFAAIREDEVEFAYDLHNAEPYRRRAFSTLQRISDEAWQRGLARLEADLALGPVPCLSRYTLLWGRAM